MNYRHDLMPERSQLWPSQEGVLSVNTQMHPLPSALLSVLHVGQTCSEGVQSIPGLTIPKEQPLGSGKCRQDRPERVNGRYLAIFQILSSSNLSNNFQYVLPLSQNSVIALISVGVSCMLIFFC